MSKRANPNPVATDDSGQPIRDMSEATHEPEATEPEAPEAVDAEQADDAEQAERVAGPPVPDASYLVPKQDDADDSDAPKQSPVDAFYVAATDFIVGFGDAGDATTGTAPATLSDPLATAVRGLSKKDRKAILSEKSNVVASFVGMAAMAASGRADDSDPMSILSEVGVVDTMTAIAALERVAREAAEKSVASGKVELTDSQALVRDIVAADLWIKLSGANLSDAEREQCEREAADVIAGKSVLFDDWSAWSTYGVSRFRTYGGQVTKSGGTGGTRGPRDPNAVSRNLTADVPAWLAERVGETVKPADVTKGIGAPSDGAVRNVLKRLDEMGHLTVSDGDGPLSYVVSDSISADVLTKTDSDEKSDEDVNA